MSLLETLWPRTAWWKPLAYWLLGALLGLLTFLAALTWHMATCAEDSCIVWVCELQGDMQCGPNTPPVIVEWPNP